jgi:hypothetical protein
LAVDCLNDPGPEIDNVSALMQRIGILEKGKARNSVRLKRD